MNFINQINLFKKKVFFLKFLINLKLCSSFSLTTMKIVIVIEFSNINSQVDYEGWKP